MAKGAKKSETAAPKKAADSAGPVDQNAIVDVRNKSDGLINTKSGSIEAGEKGKATIAELRSLNKFLEKA